MPTPLASEASERLLEQACIHIAGLVAVDEDGLCTRT
jgi:hypothetical protein